MENSKNNIILQSTKWSAIAEFLARIMTPAINIILARALDPAQFGLVATFTLVITFAEVFTDAGFQKYLIQHEFKSRTDLKHSANVAFWTNLAMSVLFWVLILFHNEGIARFVGSEGHGIEIVVLGLQIPLVAFSSIQTALFRRDFKFKQLLPIRVIVSLVPIVVTVPLAFILKNCWAIVIGNLAKELVNTVALTVKSDWKPRLYYKLHILKDMLGDTLWLMADSLMIWATTYASTLILGQKLDSYTLGIYKTGATTISPYINLLYMMTAPVLFAGLSRLQKDKKERDQVFLTYQHYAANIVLLLGVAVFMFRDTVTQILLGAQWTAATTLLGLTGISMTVCVVVAQYNSDYFRAAGKPYVALAVQSSYVAVILAVMGWASNLPFEALCIVGGTLSIAYSLISTVAMWCIFKISPIKTFCNIADSLLGCVVFVIVSSVLQKLMGQSLLSDIVNGMITVMVYLCVLCLFPHNREKYRTIPIIGRLIKTRKRVPNDEQER